MLSLEHASILLSLWLQFGVPYYAKVIHNACLAYPDWIKNKQTKVAQVTDEDITSAATTVAEPADDDQAEP